MNMKKKMAAILAVCLLVTMMVGCGAKNQPSADEGDKAVAAETSSGALAGKKIGVLFPTLANEFLATMAQKIEDGLKAEGAEVILVSSDGDAAKELEMLQNFMSMGVDYVSVFPNGASAREIGATYQQLRDAGIKVHTFGNAVTEGTFDSEVITDQYAIGEEKGKMAAEWIEKTFPDAEAGSIDVALITTQSSEESKANSNGMEAVSKYTDKAKIVENINIPFGEPASKVQEAVEIILAKHPDVKLLLTYDSVQALGADETIMSKSNIDKEKFAIITSDFYEEIGNRIRMSANNESLIRGSVTSETDPQLMVNQIMGKLELDENNIYFTPIYAVTPENVDQFNF